MLGRLSQSNTLAQRPSGQMRCQRDVIASATLPKTAFEIERKNVPPYAATRLIVNYLDTTLLFF
jgi:hypothetical protein